MPTSNNQAAIFTTLKIKYSIFHSFRDYFLFSKSAQRTTKRHVRSLLRGSTAFHTSGPRTRVEIVAHKTERGPIETQ